MQNKDKIYFIISGIRDGFKKSHLLCNNNITEVIDYIDDRRQISNSAIDRFYTIEKTQNYTLATVFNPNTKDQVGRKAYVAISLFVKKDCIIKGGLLETLNHLMSYYESKQRNEAVNMFTEQMFEAEYENLSVEKANIKQIVNGKRQGYFIYEALNAINEHFDYPEINSYKIVYFLSANNTAVINELISYEEVKSFPQSILFQISDYNTIKYDLLINNESYATAGMLSVGNLKVVAHQGDKITIVKKQNNLSKNINIPFNGETIGVYSYFPEDKMQQGTGGINIPVGGGSINGPKQVDARKKKVDKILKIAILLLLVAIVVIVLNINGVFDPKVTQTPTGDTKTPTEDTKTPPATTVTPAANTVTPPANPKKPIVSPSSPSNINVTATQANRDNGSSTHKRDPKCDLCTKFFNKITGPQDSEGYKKATKKYNEHLQIH
jgi:hypothetical protein